MTPDSNLLHSADFLSNILENISEGLAVHDSAGKIIEVSDKALQMTGLTRAQATGQEKLPLHWRVIEENGLDSNPSNHPAIKAIRTGKKQLNQLIGIRHPQSHVSWLQANSFPLFSDGSETPTGAVVTLTDVTELVTSRQKLKLEEGNWRLLSENLPGMVHVLEISPDKQIRSVYASPGSQALYEVAPEEIVHGNLILLTMLDEESKKSFFAELQKGIDYPHLEHKSWTGRFTLKSGVSKVVQVRFNIGRHSNGSLRVHSVHLDVTERVRLEKELQRSQERFERAVYGSNSGIWDWDVQTGEIWFSDNCKSMLGYEPSQLNSEPETYWNLFHPDDQIAIANLISKFLEEKKDFFSFDLRVMSAADSFRWIQIRGNCVYDRQHRPVRLTGWNIDIHEQKTISQRLELITNTIEEVFWMRDPRDGNLTYVSPAFEKIWKDSIERAKSNPSAILKNIFPGDVAEVEKFLLRQKTEEGSLTYRILWPDGSIRWVQDRTFPVRKSTGQVDLIVGVTADMTKEIETDELLEQQRTQAVNGAKMSSLGVMAAGVAHEINNPLAIITGRAQQIIGALQAGRSGKEDLIRYAEGIDRTAHRIAKIIRGLRSFSRDAEKDPMEKASVPLMIEDALSLCQTRFSNHGIQVQCGDIDPDLALLCRPAQISQILVNLLINSYDAVEGLDEKWVRLDAQKVDSSVQFRVTDNGPGVAPEIRSKIMEPFFTTKEVGHGTGLGLSIVSGLVQAHEGSVWLDEDQPNTCFVVQIPCGPDS